MFHADCMDLRKNPYSSAETTKVVLAKIFLPMVFFGHRHINEIENTFLFVIYEADL